MWTKARPTLTFIASAALVACAYWNLVSFFSASLDLPPRAADELVVREARMAGIRMNLLSLGYTGEIGFVTNSSLRGQPPSPDDEKRWGQSQYVMIPWVMVRGRLDTEFVLADFWDGPPVSPMTGLSPFYDAGSGLILFRRNQPSQ